MRPLISIGMPVKNGFKVNSKQGINLEKSLNSILNQSYSNLEIVISNDCSDDQTEIFLEKISKIDKRIKLFNQKNTLGLGPNFSFVLKKSSGEYFSCRGARAAQDGEARRPRRPRQAHQWPRSC